MSCSFCSTASTSYNEDYFFSNDSLDAIVSNIKKSGCLYVALSGGEPLLHAQFFDILNFLKKAGLRVSLTSNGTLITEAIAYKLFCSNIDWVQVTLLSSNYIEHDKIMGIDSHKKIIEAIKLLKRYNIGVTICYTKTIEFSDEESIKNIAVQMNADFITRNLLTVGCNHSEQHDDYIRDNKFKISDRSSFAILPDGTLKTCSESKLVFGNIFSDDILSMYNNHSGFGKCIKNDFKCIAELSWDNEKRAYEQLKKVRN